jgi:transposase
LRRWSQQQEIKSFPPEVREHPAYRVQGAGCRVQDQHDEYPALWAAIESIASEIRFVPQTLHEWVRKQEIDSDLHDGITEDGKAIGR